jgi:hypothetical protein
MIVERLQIEWSTGGRTDIEGPLPADTLYTITRIPERASSNSRGQ